MKKILTLLLIIVGFQFAAFAQSWDVKNDFIIYPNPANTTFTIQCKAEPASYIEVYDMLGSVVVKIDVASVSELDVDCSSWKSGYYFCKLISNNKVSKTLKLVVQH